MDQPAETAPSSSFAGFMATLTARKNSEPAWSNEGLADDVTVLSYESALRAHARYRPSDDYALNEAADPKASCPDFQKDKPQRPTNDEAELTAGGAGPPFSARDGDAGQDAGQDALRLRRLQPKSASVTIRLSEEERNRLLDRASEAGLTVSAYLRSCALEAESLRAMVKETLEQLRQSQKEQSAPTSARRRRRWLAWLFPSRRTGDAGANA